MSKMLGQPIIRGYWDLGGTKWLRRMSILLTICLCPSAYVQSNNRQFGQKLSNGVLRLSCSLRASIIPFKL
jgi:hypothetical protein